MRYKLTVAYDGTDFHGWQKQHPPDAEPLRTVQGVLENTLAHVLREPVNVLGASRTDAGVHARGQVAAFSTDASIPPERMAQAINARLPADVVIVSAVEIDASFNPISDALGKMYRYTIAHSGQEGAERPLFDRHFVTFAPCVLDAAPMHAAAQRLVGEHDFTSFTRKHHGRESTVRCVHQCSVQAAGAQRVMIEVSGNGFLYNMVRIIAGTLLDVGRGRIGPEAIPTILAARDRAAAGKTLPPEGLCLEWVMYQEPEA